MFLGDDLLAWVVLAFGGALAVGTAAALIRPTSDPEEGSLAQAPLGRSLFQILLGSLASIWALATLLA